MIHISKTAAVPISCGGFLELYSFVETLWRIIYYYRKRPRGGRNVWRYGVEMYIIAGLGNPGREYVNTRHNVGFDVVDKLAEQENIDILEKKHKALIGRGVVSGRKCVLAKPQTFMNLSGESVRTLLDYYKADEQTELIVISDDISLDVGQIRVRKKGSAGGHNGLKNIIANLGHDSFIRVKMGVGEKPKGWDLVDYVLGHFSAPEREQMDEAVLRAAEAVRMIVDQGADAAMNQFNRKV